MTNLSTRAPLAKFYLAALSAVIIIFFFWSYRYQTLSWYSWNTPINYGGDATLTAAVVRAYQTHEMPLFGSKEVSHLNAPFGANWNDWPITEDPLYYSTGLLARAVGLFPALNITFLLAAIFAGVGFLGACYYFKFDLVIATGTSVAFALPTFYWIRGPGHVALHYYWCTPLLVAGLHYLYSESSVSLNKKAVGFLLLLAVAIGIQNPYYSWMSAQLLGLSAIYFALQKNLKHLCLTIAMLAVIFAGFILCNSDTLLYRLEQGANPGAITRAFESLIFFALRIPDLFVPPEYHQWHLAGDWARTHWYGRGLANGEGGSAYLGFIGVVGVLSLVAFTLIGLVRRSTHELNYFFWHTLWVTLYGMAGGLNLVLGLAGIALFRCGNRFSIFIFCYSVLFATYLAGKYCNPKIRFLCLAAILVLVYVDQCPPRRFPNEAVATRALADSDRVFAKSVEAAIGQGGRVFQLPVVAFPEYGPVHKMADYEHLRPYLFTTSLFYSYGNVKGRHREDWQNDVAALSGREMVNALKKYGFSCILLNRSAYPDGGEKMLQSLREFAIGDFQENSQRDLVAIYISSNATAELPLTILLGQGFYGWEKAAAPSTDRWSWSVQKGSLTLNNPAQKTLKATFIATLIPYTEQTLTVSCGSETQTFQLNQPTKVIFENFEMKPGNTLVTFASSYKGEPTSNGDPRTLSFRILNPEILNTDTESLSAR